MFRFFAKKLALRKPSPNSIPMSLPRCADNDFYSVYIEIPEHNMKLICKSESPHGLEGFLWINENDGAEACVLKSTLDNTKWTLKIEHYYKGWILEYNSTLLFCVQNVLQKHRFLYSKDKLAYSRPNLPPIPAQACHPFQTKAATDSRAKLPPWQLV